MANLRREVVSSCLLRVEKLMSQNDYERDEALFIMAEIDRVGNVTGGQHKDLLGY